jgi:hypothetical protein
MRRALPFALILSTACAKVHPAPMNLDGLIHYFWDNYTSGSDENIAGGVNSLHANAYGAKVTDPRDGSFSRMTSDELDPVGLEGSRDPMKARGMYIFDVIPCTLDGIERIVYALEQDKLYTGVYDSYSRHYTSDLDAYVSRRERTLTWQVDIAATILGAHYTESLEGGIRRVEKIDDTLTPFGPILLARTWMPSPAQFPGSSKSFNQDYQIEVYYEREPGKTVHLYGIWRQMDLGTFLNLDTENDQVVATTVGHLEEWDGKTADLCKAGKP